MQYVLIRHSSQGVIEPFPTMQGRDKLLTCPSYRVHFYENVLRLYMHLKSISIESWAH